MTALKICVILKTGDAGPGERRFLRGLADDPRLSLAVLTSCPSPEPSLPVVWRGALAFEARMFPPPDDLPGDVGPMTPFSEDVAAGCDVIVDFSMSRAAARLAHLARFGLWRLSTYDEAAGLTEARIRAAVTEVALSVLTSDGEATIATARFDTKFIASRNAAFAREKSVLLMLRELARVSRDGTLPAPVTAPSMSPVPRGADLADYLCALTWELAMRVVRRIEAKRGKRPGMFFLRLSRGPLSKLDPASGVDLLPPGNTYWADPFLMEHEGETFLFYEDFDYATHHGHLSVGRLDGMRMEPLGPVMQMPHHLSFPFVFRWKGEVWMIPETHQAKRIELWRATDFPLEWEREAVGFDGLEASDTVVFEHGGQWWLMTNVANDSFGDFGSELHLFAIDDPMMTNPRPHPLNPVVLDATTARNGGRVFVENGRLYRASQDNSNGVYGYGLNLMEITELSMTGYRERRVRHITPDALDGIMGMHHMDAGGGYTVMDLRRSFTGQHKSGRGKDEDPAAQEDGHEDEPDHRDLHQRHAQSKI
ncbi:MAG: hypothetical protein VX874_25535 [Pseudomonadota bacterium]|nr:hypothetical protein [Pseudomonadota bacterium]